MAFNIGLLWNYDYRRFGHWPREFPHDLRPQSWLCSALSAEIMVTRWLVSDGRPLSAPQLCNRSPYEDAYYSAWCLMSVSSEVYEVISQALSHVLFEDLLSVNGMEAVFEGLYRCCSCVRQHFLRVERKLEASVRRKGKQWTEIKRCWTRRHNVTVVTLKHAMHKQLARAQSYEQFVRLASQSKYAEPKLSWADFLVQPSAVPVWELKVDEGHRHCQDLRGF